MEKQRIKAVCCAASAGGMWGTIGLFVSLAGRHGVHSLELTVVRMVIGAAALGITLLLLDRKLLRIKVSDFPWFGAAGILCLLLFNVSYGIAIEKSSMAAAAVLLYTSPVFVTVIAVPVFGERISGRKLTAVLLAITGCAFVSGIMSGNVTFPAAAFFWGILAAFGYAMYSIIAGALLKRYHALTVLFYAFFSATCAGCFLADMGHVVYSITQKPQLVPILAAAACVCNIFSYLLYNTALKYMEPGSVSVIASVEPAVAAILGELMLGEHMGFFGVAGILCILAAIVVLNGRTGRRAYERKTSGAYPDPCESGGVDDGKTAVPPASHFGAQCEELYRGNKLF